MGYAPPFCLHACPTYDIIRAKEKQAALKATFVFLALLTSKKTAQQAGKRCRRGLASSYDIIRAKEKQAMRSRSFYECEAELLLYYLRLERLCYIY